MPGGSRHRPASLEEQVAWAAGAFVAAELYGVRAVQIMDCRGRKTRASGPVLQARRTALYLAAVAGNLSCRALCRASGMDHTTITRHLAAVEDVREVGGGLEVLLDRMTERLGKVLPEAARAEPPRAAA